MKRITPATKKQPPPVSAMMNKKRTAAAFKIPMALSQTNTGHDGFEMYAFQAERSDGPFTCLKCKEGVILRKGTKKAHHFAHRPSSTCKIKSHAVSESAKHKYAKAILSSTLTLWTISRRCANSSTPLKCMSEDITTFSDKHKAIQELQCGHYRLDIGVQVNGVTCTAVEVRYTSAVSAEKRLALQCSGIDVLEVDATCVIAAFDTKRFVTTDVCLDGWYCPRCKPTRQGQDQLVEILQPLGTLRPGPAIRWACNKRHRCLKHYEVGRIVRNKPWNGMVSMYTTPGTLIFGVFVQPYEPKRLKLEELFRRNPTADFYWASPITIQGFADFTPLRLCTTTCNLCIVPPYISDLSDDVGPSPAKFRRIDETSLTVCKDVSSDDDDSYEPDERTTVWLSSSNDDDVVSRQFVIRSNASDWKQRVIV